MSDEELKNQEPVVTQSVGSQLRAARESKGWSLADAGARLRLMARQIEAMESDDFASLGQQVFARGFVRNYARLLELDAEAMLAQMALAIAPPVPQPENVPFAPKPGFWASPWVLGPLVAVVLALAVPVGLYLWLNSDEPETPVAAAVEQPALPPPPPPAPAAEPKPDMQPEPEPAVAPVPATGQPVAAPAGQASAPAAAPPAPPAPVPLPPPAPVQQVPNKPAPVLPAPRVLPVPATVPAAPLPPVAPPAAAAQTIRFRFVEPSWLRVSDASGKVVHSATNQAGTATEVTGVPPFALVVGNAAGVVVIYKNQPVDIKPFTDLTVARFTLN